MISTTILCTTKLVLTLIQCMKLHLVAMVPSYTKTINMLMCNLSVTLFNSIQVKGLAFQFPYRKGTALCIFNRPYG